MDPADHLRWRSDELSWSAGPEFGNILACHAQILGDYCIVLYDLNEYKFINLGLISSMKVHNNQYVVCNVS